MKVYAVGLENATCPIAIRERVVAGMCVGPKLDAVQRLGSPDATGLAVE